jgi:hypothetical protein
MAPPVNKQGAPPPVRPPVSAKPKPAKQEIIALNVKPVAIKVPTPKKGTKRVAKPPAVPKGARGPFKIKPCGAK